MMRVSPLAPLAACCALAACDVAQSGQGGVLTFAWQELERSLPVAFDTPVAAGLSGAVAVTSVGSDAALAVTAATSSDPEILEVRSVDFNVIQVRARSPGTVTITVETDGGRDTIELHVAELATVDLSGPGFLVPETPTPRAVVGGRMALAVALRDAGGGRLTGYGELPVVIRADPPEASDAARFVGQGFIRPTFLAEGPVTLTPGAGEGFALEVVAPSALVDLELRGLQSLTSLAVGESASGVLRGLTNDAATVAGLDGVVTLAAAEAICRIVPNTKLGDGVFEVTAVASGTCTITGTVAGAGGYTEQWSFQVGP